MFALVVYHLRKSLKWLLNARSSPRQAPASLTMAHIGFCGPLAKALGPRFWIGRHADRRVAERRCGDGSQSQAVAAQESGQGLDRR
jgi:hypothetical protein